VATSRGEEIVGLAEGTISTGHGITADQQVLERMNEDIVLCAKAGTAPKTPGRRSQSAKGWGDSNKGTLYDGTDGEGRDSTLSIAEIRIDASGTTRVGENSGQNTRPVGGKKDQHVAAW
jgi:hypothetical protein